MSLAATLDTMVNADHYGPEDDNWVQFIKDHRQYIIDRCTRHKPTSLELAQYRYRSEAYFREKFNAALNAIWIFEYLNDLKDPSSFNESITSLWVFDMEVIKKLRASFESSIQYRV